MLRIKKVRYICFEELLHALYGYFLHLPLHLYDAVFMEVCGRMVGKGLEMTVLAQFFFYSALSLVPASLPLAILLAALITFGNFGDVLNYLP